MAVDIPRCADIELHLVAAAVDIGIIRNLCSPSDADIKSYDGRTSYGLLFSSVAPVMPLFCSNQGNALT